MSKTLNLSNCKCGASGYILSPAWFNNLKGYIGLCVAKNCNIRTKEYRYKGNAFRFWNKK